MITKTNSLNNINEITLTNLENGEVTLEQLNEIYNKMGFVFVANKGRFTKIRKEIKDKKELSLLYNENELNYGYIICKCNLVDCIYITEDFINNLKKKNYTEYICGHYEVGRYAWLLKDIEIITPIRVKGQLGIWNY